MSSREDNLAVRRMAELLRAGATMLPETCPVHRVPLFRLKSGEVICPVCRKRVVFVREGEEAKALGVVALAELEQAVYEKLRTLTNEVRRENEPERTYDILRSIIACLEVLDRIKKLSS